VWHRELAAHAQATVRLTRVFAFEDAYNIAGGTYAWQAAGYPLEYDR
jgi:rhodanese-related sulfurtransferase